MMNKINKRFNLIILGPQGSGKGTQAEMLAEKFDMKIISLGDIARNEVKKETVLSLKIKKYLGKGELLPEELAEKLIFNSLKLIKKDGIIFDAFPRNFEQVHILEKLLKEFNLQKPIVIYLKISSQTAMKRLLSRRICPKCGQVFYQGSSDYQKGICPKCQTKIIRRADDKPEIIKNRLKIYFQETQKIIHYYQKEKRLLEINGELTIPEVSQEILEKLNDYLEKSA